MKPALSAFLTSTRQQAQARRSGSFVTSSFTSSYTQASLYLDINLNMELVDTPGLGATPENESIAVDAVSTADVILWTMDVESIGGAREAAVLERFQTYGQPLLIALTKTDLVDDDEIEDIVTYIAKTYGLPPDAVIPICADQEILSGDDVGIKRLRHRLASLSPSRASFRAQALEAQVVDVTAELEDCMKQVHVSLGKAMGEATQNLHSMLEMAAVVTDDICLEISSKLRDRLRQEVESISCAPD